MKNILSYIGFSLVTLLLATLLFACEKQELPQDAEISNQEINYSSVNEIVQLGLDRKFNIPNEVYQDFLTNTIFRDNQLQGFKYTEIDRLFDDSQSNAFWANFGISVRSNASTLREDQPAPVRRPRYLGKKPITGGCEPNVEFICFGQDDSDIKNYKPIEGGCQWLVDYVCFNP